MIILTLFVLNVTFADTTWPMYGGTLENTRTQLMKGHISIPAVKWSYPTGAAVEEGGEVADVNGDGKMEVVFGSDDYMVYCVDGATGVLDWNYPTGSYIYASTAIADVDGDTKMEVVVGSLDGKVYCLNGINGALKWSYVTTGQIWDSPEIADLKGNGNMEIVIGSGGTGEYSSIYDSTVYCLDGTNGLLLWSYKTGDVINSSPAIADLDGDSKKEVIIGSYDGKLYCLNGTTGAVKWSSVTGNMFWSSPAIADLDGDDTLEIIMGTGTYPSTMPGDSVVFCLNGATGRIKWSYKTGGQIWSSPAITDINGDTNLEVLIGSFDGKIYCFDGKSGAVDWSYSASGNVHRGISVADINGDNKPEVLIPNFGLSSLICLNGKDGALLWQELLAFDVHDATIADIDNDGCVELLVGTASPGVLWALDDSSNTSNCGNMSAVEEKSKELKVENLEFKVIGEKIYLYTPNTIAGNIRIYDICGRVKEIIYQGVLSKGSYTFTTNVKLRGLYFATLTAGNYTETKKLILIK